MKFKDVFIGSTIVGIFSYIVSAVIFPLLLKGNDNFKATTFQIIPAAIGLLTFLMFFSHYSLVDITPHTWEFCKKWDEPADCGRDENGLD